jgi:hypothetical protein
MLPTICALVGVPIPEGVDGRVLSEVLRSADANSQPDVATTSFIASTPAKDYTVTLHESRVAATRYVDYTKTQHAEN